MQSMPQQNTKAAQMAFFGELLDGYINAFSARVCRTSTSSSGCPCRGRQLWPPPHLLLPGWEASPSSLLYLSLPCQGAGGILLATHVSGPV